jgi:hypothetical protein
VWIISAEQLFSTVNNRTAHCNGRFLFPCTSMYIPIKSV